MDETKVISDESGWPSVFALRIRHAASFPMDDVKVDESDEGDEGNSEENKAIGYKSRLEATVKCPRDGF